MAAILLVLAAPAFARSRTLGARVLKQGMSGPDVRALQQQLTKAGYPGASTGSFNAATVVHVRRFQRAYHLAVTGVVNAAFVRRLRHVVALRSSAPPAAEDGYSGGAAFLIAPPTAIAPITADKPPQTASSRTAGQLGSRVLRLGMNGADVSQLQGELTVAGFATGIDGQFGPVTKTSVTEFEQAHSLPGDGVVSAAIVRALQLAVAAYDTSTATGTARIHPDGTATAPAGAPRAVKQMVAAANRIISKPYRYAGGHGTWNDVGYDCSGSVSYALHGAGLLDTADDSTGLASYGFAGPGRWVTIYADPGHAWIVIAGIAFDTANFGGPNIPDGSGPRWRSNAVGNLADGGSYVARHPMHL